MFYFCQSSVCLYSTLIRRFQDKLSTFFFFPFTLPLSDEQQQQQQLLSLSASTQLYSQISHLIEHGQKKYIKKPHAGLRPPSSLIRDRVHKSLKHLCPPNKFSAEAEGAVAQGWGFEERMKPARLRLETLSGIFHHFLSVQGMKPKCCHLHIFLVESTEKSEKHFGEHFKLGMCLFPGLACLALNEIQSLFRQQQIRHN